jgi:hypothetical protein
MTISGARLQMLLASICSLAIKLVGRVRQNWISIHISDFTDDPVECPEWVFEKPLRELSSGPSSFTFARQLFSKSPNHLAL